MIRVCPPSFTLAPLQGLLMQSACPSTLCPQAWGPAQHLGESRTVSAHPAHSGVLMGWGRRESLPEDLPLTPTASRVVGRFWVDSGWWRPFLSSWPISKHDHGCIAAVRRIWRFWGLFSLVPSLLFRSVVRLPNELHLWDSWSCLCEGQAGGAVFTDNPAGVLAFCHWQYSEGVKVWATQSCPTLCDHVAGGSPGSSVLEILKEEILEYVAMVSTRGLSRFVVWTQVSYAAGRFFTVWTTRGAPRIIVSSCKVLI